MVQDNKSEATAWYLVHTKPQQEYRAQENLKRQGYTTYLPVFRNRRRRKNRYIERTEPLFPRYLFIQLSQETDNWAPIRSTIGVSALVRFGTRPAQVPNELVEVLVAREDENGIQDLPPPEFTKGDRVRIVEGVMSGLEGIYMAKDSTERVTILLEIAGRHTRVSLSEHSLYPTDR